MNRLQTCGVCGGPAWSRARSCHRCSAAAQAQEQTLIDVIAVERLVMGDPPARTTRAERQEAVRVLAAWRLSDREIAARMRVSERTVERLRSRSRAEGLVAA